MEKPFPVYLSAPLTILWWEFDVFILANVMIAFALVLGGIFWIAVIFVPSVYWYVQRDKPRGYLKHIYYAIGIHSLKGYPTYFEKEFHE